MEPDGEAANGGRGDIQVVSRVAALLASITSADPSLDIQRAADVLGVGRSTAHRYLASMERAALLQRDGTAKYVLGSALVRIGAIAFAGSGLVEAAGPIMRELASEILGTIVLSVWGGDAPVVARVERNPRQTTSVAVDVGSSLGTESAQSMLFEAFQSGSDAPSDARDGVSRHPREDAPDGAVLVARHMYVEGALKVIAVPVMSRNGDLVATLAVLGFGASLPDGDDAELIDNLVTAAGKLRAS